MAEILLVEDNARDVEITLSNLRAGGITAAVQVVRDGEEALDYLNRREGFALRSTPQPTMLLLDIKMPKVNGLEVLKAMKSDHALSSIPVVLLSASREEHDMAAAFEWRAEGYLIKPASPQQLAAMLLLATGGANPKSR